MNAADNPKFEKTYCSQCAGEFGPGNDGYSHCEDHRRASMSVQHTPGPWFTTKDSAYNDVARIGRAWIIGSDLALSHFGHPDADARLIAAAPDLLAALEKVWSEGVIPDGFALLQDQVCDAIAKATGGAA